MRTRLEVEKSEADISRELILRLIPTRKVPLRDCVHDTARALSLSFLSDGTHHSVAVVFALLLGVFGVDDDRLSFFGCLTSA